MSFDIFTQAKTQRRVLFDEIETERPDSITPTQQLLDEPITNFTKELELSTQKCLESDEDSMDFNVVTQVAPCHRNRIINDRDENLSPVFDAPTQKSVGVSTQRPTVSAKSDVTFDFGAVTQVRNTCDDSIDKISEADTSAPDIKSSKFRSPTFETSTIEEVFDFGAPTQIKGYSPKCKTLDPFDIEKPTEAVDQNFVKTQRLKSPDLEMSSSIQFDFDAPTQAPKMIHHINAETQRIKSPTLENSADIKFEFEAPTQAPKSTNYDRLKRRNSFDLEVSTDMQYDFEAPTQAPKLICDPIARTQRVKPGFQEKSSDFDFDLEAPTQAPKPEHDKPQRLSSPDFENSTNIQFDLEAPTQVPKLIEENTPKIQRSRSPVDDSLTDIGLDLDAPTQVSKAPVSHNRKFQFDAPIQALKEKTFLDTDERVSSCFKTSADSFDFAALPPIASKHSCSNAVVEKEKISDKPVEINPSLVVKPSKKKKPRLCSETTPIEKIKKLSIEDHFDDKIKEKQVMIESLTPVISDKVPNFDIFNKNPDTEAEDEDKVLENPDKVTPLPNKAISRIQEQVTPTTTTPVAKSDFVPSIGRNSLRRRKKVSYERVFYNFQIL